jgi:putative ABC transport system permease protein
MKAVRALIPTAFRFALASLGKRKLESLLLAVALATAYAAAGTVLSVLSGFRARLAEDLSRIGWDVINVHPNPDWKLFLRSLLTDELIQDLARIAGGEWTAASLEMVLVSAGAPPAPLEAAVAVGTTPRWAAITDMRLKEGRFFAEDDRPTCVLDEWLARRLFKEDHAAGRTIEITIGGRKLSLEVAGVAEDPFRIRERFGGLESPGGGRNLVFRLMEYKNLYLPRHLLGAEKPPLFALLTAPPGVEPAAAVEKIRAALRERGSAAIAWDRRSWARRLIGASDEIGKLASFLWIAVLAITALMAAAVLALAMRTRYGEIAVRRIEGARRADVLAQLLAEAALLSLAAGVAGLALAALASLWIERGLLGWPVRARPLDLALVLATGIGLAAATAFLPARRAANLPPVETLRRA